MVLPPRSFQPGLPGPPGPPGPWQVWEGSSRGWGPAHLLTSSLGSAWQRNAQMAEVAGACGPCCEQPVD